MTTTNDMNAVVKDKDDRITELKELAEGIRADYETLKRIIFEELNAAVSKKYTAPYGNYTANMVAMERWTTLQKIVDMADIGAEYEAFKKAMKEAK